MTDTEALNAPGLGESQRAILETLKRRGSATTPVLAAELGLNVETVRSHLRALLGHGLVRRGPTVRSGPGRPETVFGLTDRAEALRLTLQEYRQLMHANEPVHTWPL